MPSGPSLTRRRFLVLSGGALVLAACGSNGSSGSSDSTLSEHHDDEPTNLSPAVMSSDLYARPEPQRFAFAMLSKEGFASVGEASLAVAHDPATPTKFAPTTLHTRGLPENRGIYVSDVIFDKAGVWNAIVRRGDEDLPFAIQVNQTATAPVEGDAAPTAASPTNTDSLGMAPICTHSPECPLHDKSLDTLIGKGRPVAVMFATPARCKSRYCGPVLDALLPLVDQFSDRVDIVHCDIYLNNRTDEVSPTVAAWSLPSEPWLFGIDPSGRITHRLDGAMAQDEILAVLTSLAGGA
jgi:hypothetical protein